MKQLTQIEIRINIIAKELVDGKSRVDIMSKYGKKWRISDRTYDRYLKSAKEIAKRLSNKANKAAEDTYIETTKEAVIQGLKTKIERAMFYQNEIHKMEAQLSGEIKFSYIVGNKLMQSHRGKNFIAAIQVQNDIRNTIRAYQMEISRIEGDYEKDNKQLSTVIKVTRK